MANDYIPRGDAELNGWLANFVTCANANLAGLGLVAGDMTPVATAQTAWHSKYPAHVAAAAAAISAREGKDAAGRSGHDDWGVAPGLIVAPSCATPQTSVDRHLSLRRRWLLRVVEGSLLPQHHAHAGQHPAG